MQYSGGGLKGLMVILVVPLMQKKYWGTRIIQQQRK
ncbi:hypothetical protein LHK13_04066 [Providencia rettgeri]|nr:hypothetical protein [Providencia rettgeri]